MSNADNNADDRIKRQTHLLKFSERNNKNCIEILKNL